MEKFAFTTGNVKKFFHTDTNGLPPNQAKLVQAIGLNFGPAAYSVVETFGQNELGQHIIGDMVGTYSKSVALITCGWAGNA